MLSYFFFVFTMYLLYIKNPIKLMFSKYQGIKINIKRFTLKKKKKKNGSLYFPKTLSFHEV